MPLPPATCRLRLRPALETGTATPSGVTLGAAASPEQLANIGRVASELVKDGDTVGPSLRPLRIPAHRAFAPAHRLRANDGARQGRGPPEQPLLAGRGRPFHAGLGSGRAALSFVRELGTRVKDGLTIVGVPTSIKTADLATELGIPLATLEAVRCLPAMLAYSALLCVTPGVGPRAREKRNTVSAAVAAGGVDRHCGRRRGRGGARHGANQRCPSQGPALRAAQARARPPLRLAGGDGACSWRAHALLHALRAVVMCAGGGGNMLREKIVEYACLATLPCPPCQLPGAMTILRFCPA